jgi:hypothetical protein
MSVNARVVLLVKDDMTLYVHAYQRKDRLSHYQNSTSLSAFSSILKIFEGPMSVGVIIVLLVEDDLTLYTMVRSYQRKDRLSHYQKLTSLSAFGSILKDFLEGTDVGKCEGRTFG